MREDSGSHQARHSKAQTDWVNITARRYQKGTPLHGRHVTARHFQPLLKRAGLPQIRFHDLRHTCDTLLLTKNVNPKIVSEMLGHATVAITLDTYSHILPNMQSEAAKAMEDALS